MDTSSNPKDVIGLITAFNVALNNRDIDRMMSLMSDDCVFENTYPPPDGTRFTGKTEIRKFWENFFISSISFHFSVEEIFVSQDRCVMLWNYHWQEKNGNDAHIRGVDIYKVISGLICEKLSYVKG